jgi:hypothetical protein
MKNRLIDPFKGIDFLTDIKSSYTKVFAWQLLCYYMEIKYV